MRFLIAAIGTLGDVLPAIGVGRLLADRGHDAIVATNPAYVPRVEEAGLDARLIGTAEGLRRVIDNSAFRDPVDAFSLFAREVVMPSMGPLARLVTRFAKEGRLVVIGLNYGHGALVAARQLGLPAARAYIQPAGPALDARFGRAQARLDAFAAFQGATYGRGDGRVKRIGLFPHWFWPGNDPPDDLVATGFPLYDGPRNQPLPSVVAHFLGSGPPPIVVAAGSETGWTGHGLLTRIRQATDAVGLRSLIVNRETGLKSSATSLVVPFLPYSRVLPDAVAMIHHGGIGTIAQCLAAGRPQLALTSNFETPENAAAMVRLGVGAALRAADISADAVACTLDRLVGDPRTSDVCATVAERLRRENPFDTAATVLEKLAAGL